MKDIGTVSKYSGAFLIAAGILNMMARIGLSIDLVVTFLLILAGAFSLEDVEYRHEFAFICSIIGVVYPILKLILFYFWLPDIVDLPAGELLGLGSIFLVPMSALSLIALYGQLKLTPKKYPRY